MKDEVARGWISAPDATETKKSVTNGRAEDCNCHCLLAIRFQMEAQSLGMPEPLDRKSQSAKVKVVKLENGQETSMRATGKAARHHFPIFFDCEMHPHQISADWTAFGHDKVSQISNTSDVMVLVPKYRLRRLCILPKFSPSTAMEP